MCSLFSLTISTVVLPQNCNPYLESLSGLALTRNSFEAHLGPSATSQTLLDLLRFNKTYYKIFFFHYIIMSLQKV